MIALRPGGFWWLVRHEVRLGWRARARGLSALVGGALLLIYLCVGILVATTVVDRQVRWSPQLGGAMLIGSLAALTFMVAQAMLAGQRTLYETRDLDLLLTSPVPGRRVLAAKQAGIATSIVLGYAILILPMLVPFALLGHPRLLGLVGVMIALALAGAAIGLALVLLLARTIGARASRAVGQILAALIGAAFYLVTQLGRLEHGLAYRGLFGWAQAHRLGASGASGWPGRAAFGDPVALVALVVPAALLFAGVGALLETAFLSGYQDGGARSVRPRERRGGPARAFSGSLNRAVFAKEWRLLARDPALLFRLVLRLVYLAPLLLIGFRQGGAILAPSFAFASVLVSSQLVGSIAWLTIRGEDAPELLTVAPVDKAVIERAKLLAALAMAAPIGLIAPLAMLALAPLGALVTLAFTSAASWCCGLVELHFGKPGQRAQFARRAQGSFVAAILALIIAFGFGGAAAVLTWWLG